MTHCIVTNHEWKDLKGWQDYGITLSTTSNEAAKMFDALMTQLYQWYDDESLGGIPGTVKRIREADPDYMLGPLLESRFKLSSQSVEIRPELLASLKEMDELAEKNPGNEWEMKLAAVIKDYAHGHGKKSLRNLEEMLHNNPRDVVSLRFGYMFALMLGDWKGIRDVMPKVVEACTPDMAFYGYIQGMYGFVLNEFKQPREAEKYTKEALSINPCDCWSTHATAHILVETNRAEDGIKFMENNEAHWTTGTFLLEHNYWHWALFHLDKGDYESVLGILDDHILERCTRGSVFALCDASSLLYRLQLEGVSTGERWENINSFWPCNNENGSVFVETHKMMNHLGAKDYKSASSLIESCEKFVREGKGNNWEVTKEVGVSLCEAMLAFDKAKYDDAIELILPIRDDVIRIGGSNAQRDVFNLLLTQAAIQSSSSRNKNLASKLVHARKKLNGEDGVTQRLEARLQKKLASKADCVFTNGFDFRKSGCIGFDEIKL